MAGSNGVGGWIGFIVVVLGFNLLSYLFGWGYILY